MILGILIFILTTIFVSEYNEVNNTLKLLYYLLIILVFTPLFFHITIPVFNFYGSYYILCLLVLILIYFIGFKSEK